MIALFTTELSPRLTYVAGQVFTQWLGHDISWFTNPSDFESFEGVKINYSNLPLTADIQIKPAGLLTETGIHSKPPGVETLNGIPVLFPNNGTNDFSFDFFSAVFWMISRMEEYEFEKKDRFNRFSGYQSFAYRAGFLDLPIVDVWLRILINSLPEEKRPLFHTDAFKFTATIDVDNAYAIYGKPYWRQVMASVRDFLKGKPGYISTRWKIWNGKQTDPYDSYSFLEETSHKYKTSFTFFYLLGDYSRRDRNLSWQSDILRKVIYSNLKWSKSGVHPSFSSYENPKIIQRDVQRLKEIGGTRVNQSRQHYLRCRFPVTFQHLIEAGIRNDYTLGFHDLPGYRAGTGRSFHYYDIAVEQETELIMHPFVFMDGTFHDYMRLSAQQAIKKTEEIFETAKKYGTPVCSVWHNDTVNSQGSWIGWQQVFLRQFELADK